MGAFAKTLLQLLAAAVLLAIGYFFPSALASTLSWLDAAVASIADNAEPTGTLKLILQFAGAGFAVLMALLVIAAGFTMRQFVSQTLFRWRYVMTAGLIPLLAHVVKWGLGLWWPTLLVPVHTLTGGVYNWFSPETQIQLDLFNFKGHVMTIILGLVLILLWLLVTFIWRWFFGSKAAASAPPPQTPAPSGNSKWSKIMSIFEKPIKFYREKIMPIFSKFYNGVRGMIAQIFSKPYNWLKGRFRKTPAPAAGGQQPPTPQPQPPTGIMGWLKFGLRLPVLILGFIWKGLVWLFDRDIVFGPISWTVFILLLGAGVAYTIATILALAGALCVQYGLLAQNPLTGNVHVLVQVLFTVIFWLPHWEQVKMKVKGAEGEEEKEVDSPWKLKMVKVPPPARGMPLSWIGMMTPFVLSSGDYPLFGEWLGFGRVDITSTTIAKDGYLILSDVTYTVWQSPDKATSSITLQAGNGATVTGNLSFILQGRRRMRWEAAGDAGTQAGNRARQELQEIIEPFVDTDVKSVQGEMSRLMRGEAMLTCFMPKETGGRKAGSMVRDSGGKPIYVFVDDFADVTAATAALQTKIQTTGDQSLIAGLGKDANGGFLVTQVQANKPVTEVFNFLGWPVKEVVYDSVRASEIVETISNKASSEEKQREIQLASARTAAAASREMQITDEERTKLSPAELQARIENQRIQLAIDSPNGNVRFLHLAGDTTGLVRGLVAADSINEKDEK